VLGSAEKPCAKQRTGWLQHEPLHNEQPGDTCLHSEKEYAITTNPHPTARNEFTASEAHELDSLTAALAAVFYPDLPEKLAVLKMERTLKEEFDRRERASGQHLIENKDFIPRELAEILGMHINGARLRFCSESSRESMLATKRRAGMRKREAAQKFAAIKELLE